MLAGHYAPALALHARLPRAPLWSLFLAVQAVDVAFFALALVGVERSEYDPQALPRFKVTSGVITHSLVTTPLWGLLALALGWRARGAAVGLGLALAVVSHWPLDLVVHAPDLPLGLSQEPAVGLSLWCYPPWSLVLELLLLAGGWGLLRRGLLPRPRRHLDLLFATLAGIQLVTDLAMPLPSSPQATALSALGLYGGLALLAWRVDVARARASDGGPPPRAGAPAPPL